MNEHKGAILIEQTHHKTYEYSPNSNKHIISIIICGINDDYRTNITQNIKNTIGTSFELLYFDNRVENKSISVVYNTLKAKTQGEYLCFLHEDLFINTANWGVEILKIFQEDPSVGLVGIAGTMYKSRIPSSWSCIDPQFLACNYIQHFKDKTRKPIAVKYNTTETEHEVVMVDGLFMCINQDVNQKIQFDEEIIKGFHGYDFNLSLQTIHLKKKIIATNRILIDHFSDGHINKDWYYTYYSMSKKWNSILPLTCVKMSFIDKISSEYSCFYSGFKAVKKTTAPQIISFLFHHFSFHFLWYYLYKRFYSPRYSIIGKRTNLQET